MHCNIIFFNDIFESNIKFNWCFFCLFNIVVTCSTLARYKLLRKYFSTLDNMFLEFPCITHTDHNPGVPMFYGDVAKTGNSVCGINVCIVHHSAICVESTIPQYVWSPSFRNMCGVPHSAICVESIIPQYVWSPSFRNMRGVHHSAICVESIIPQYVWSPSFRNMCGAPHSAKGAWGVNANVDFFQYDFKIYLFNRRTHVLLIKNIQVHIVLSYHEVNPIPIILPLYSGEYDIICWRLKLLIGFFACL